MRKRIIGCSWRRIRVKPKGTGKLLNQVASRMTVDQIAEARKLAKTFVLKAITLVKMR